MTADVSNHLPEVREESALERDPVARTTTICGVFDEVRYRIVQDALAADERGDAMDVAPLDRIIGTAYTQCDISLRQCAELRRILNELSVGEKQKVREHREMVGIRDEAMVV
ncbi:MAG: hypothetical protein PHO92_00580 [Candidatus Peribacteraceae bacterium]|nr:hypothetical protein [Candidatus Peribacteraceae bacterium]